EAHFRRGLAVWERRAPGSGDHAATLAQLARVPPGPGEAAGAQGADAHGPRRGQPAAAQEAYAQALHALENQTSRLGGAASVRSGFRARHVAKYRDYPELLVERGGPGPPFKVLRQPRRRT